MILALGFEYRGVALGERLTLEKIDSIHPAIIVGANQQRKWANGIPLLRLPVPQLDAFTTIDAQMFDDLLRDVKEQTNRSSGTEYGRNLPVASAD